MTGSGVDPTGSHFAWANGRRVHIARLGDTIVDPDSGKTIQHDRTVAELTFDERGRRLATSDTDGTIRVWSLAQDPPELTLSLSKAAGEKMMINRLRFDPSGSMLGGFGGHLWDLTAPHGSDPLLLHGTAGVAFAPQGNWLATGSLELVSLWPLKQATAKVLRGHQAIVTGVVFAPDGRRLISTSRDGSVRVWPLTGDAGEQSNVCFEFEGHYEAPVTMAVSPDGTFLVTGSIPGRVVVVSPDDCRPRDLVGPYPKDLVRATAIGPEGRLVAAAAGDVIVWDLRSKVLHGLRLGEYSTARYLEFTQDADLWVDDGVRFSKWDMGGVEPRIVHEVDLSGPDGTGFRVQDLSSDGKHILFIREDRLWNHDLENGSSHELSSHGQAVSAASFDAGGSIVVSTDPKGAVSVGMVRSSHSHLLLGNEGSVSALAVSPDGRWIATGGADSTIRLWPMPDISQPPLYTLPRSELIAKLKTLTNLRAIRDEESSTGWKIEVGPFPGWETVPTW
jgi:WD40 repeat protein